MQASRINTILWGMAVLSLAAVGIAVYTQVAFDWRPCPWCILQRIIFVAIAIVCIVAALLRGVASRMAPLIVALVLALLGVASTLWQHFVAAKSASCSLTLADKIIAALHVDDVLPSVFAVTGMCADAAVSLLNVPLEFWSLALYAVLALLSVRLLVRVPQEGRPSYLR